MGSTNQDLVLHVDRIPLSGQTLLGDELGTFPGGKGANQAVACARLGVSTSLIGAVGDDTRGRELVQCLQDNDVDTAAVVRRPATPSGAAYVMLDATGENAIIVVAGANATLSAADVARHRARLDAAVTLVQLEIPVAAVTAACRHATGIVVLNPAPAQTLPAELLRHVDVIVPNEHELLELVGDVADAGTDAGTGAGIERLKAAARELSRRTACVVTLGARGALLAQDGRVVHVPPHPAEVVDTTGAGDAFCGGLAVGLADGRSLAAAVEQATVVAGLATTRLGAQQALPTAADLRAAAPRSRDA